MKGTSNQQTGRRKRKSRRRETIENLRHEVCRLQKKEFDPSLLDVFTGEREGTPREQQKLKRTSQRLGERIYSEIVYFLTHTTIEQSSEARKTFEDILAHRNEMVRALGRHISIEVAALDYMQSIRTILKKPTIIESDQYNEFDNTHITSRDQLVAAADAAMYQAEKDRANRICIHEKQSLLSGYTRAGGGSRTADERERRIVPGHPLVGGVGIGRPFVYRDILSRESEVRLIEKREIDGELQRIHSAVETVKKDYDEIRKILDREGAKEQQAIFNVHKMLLEDRELLMRLETELKKKRINAENVVRSVFRQIEQRFRCSGSSILSERIIDLQDLGRRLLKVMTGVEENILTGLPAGSVVFSRRLLPSDTIHFTRQKPAAIVTEEGGPNSHSALIARTMGIPSISNVRIRGYRLRTDAPVIVDAHEGIVILNPNPEEMRNAHARIRSAGATRGAVLREARRHDSARTAEGYGAVLANVSTPLDVRIARDSGCEGIGLYRTENIYMLCRKPPGEKYLYGEIKRSLQGVEHMPLVLRLADIGGDKTLPYMSVPHEHNMYLGVRGVRYLLHYPQMLSTQLRVFMSLAAEYDVRILVPFVALADDMLRVRECMEKIRTDMKSNGDKLKNLPPLGAMLETPLSVFTVERILDVADFISVGTNDLQQFVTAADRESLNVSPYFQAGDSSVIDMVADVVAACNRRGKECCVCGEIAGKKEYIRRLHDAGLRRFSVTPQLVPMVKEELFRLQQNTGSGRKKKHVSAAQTGKTTGGDHEEKLLCHSRRGRRRNARAD